LFIRNAALNSRFFDIEPDVDSLDRDHPAVYRMNSRWNRWYNDITIFNELLDNGADSRSPQEAPMHRFSSTTGKLLRSGLAALVALILLLPLNLSVAAAGPKVEWQVAPLNPAFLRYVQQQAVRDDFLHGLSLRGVDISHLGEKNYGYIPRMTDSSYLAETNQNKNYTAAAALPATFDWRASQKVTPVKDQGTAGTCWAFGTLASLESRILIMDNQEYDLSELNLAAGVDPSWVEYQKDRADTGGDSYLATDALAKIGTRSEATQPYGNPNQAAATVNNAVADTTTPPLQKVTDFRIVAAAGISSADTNTIKRTIYAYGPVSAAFYYDNGRITSNYVYDYPDCQVDANHMISIVGWNDTIAHPLDGGKGAWIVKNSWDANWGDNGYFYLCYGAANLQEVGSYHGTDAAAGYEYYQPGERLYYWDEAGFLFNFGTGNSSSASMRSVFTSTSAGSLTRVNLWTTGNNTQYQINIRNGEDSLLGTQSGTCEESGYYSINLFSPVPLSANQQFVVEATLTTPGYNFPLAAGGKISGIYDPPIQAGQCYYRPSSEDSWTDV
jgi:C1A family cysteine protease